MASYLPARNRVSIVSKEMPRRCLISSSFEALHRTMSNNRTKSIHCQSMTTCPLRHSSTECVDIARYAALSQAKGLLGHFGRTSNRICYVAPTSQQGPGEVVDAHRLRDLGDRLINREFRPLPKSARDEKRGSVRHSDVRHPLRQIDTGRLARRMRPLAVARICLYRNRDRRSRTDQTERLSATVPVCFPVYNRKCSLTISVNSSMLLLPSLMIVLIPSSLALAYI